MRVREFPLRACLRRRLAEEQGIAMVLVVGMSAILFAIAAIVMTRNFSDYNQVRSNRRFEQAIQVADSGVDHTLYKVGALPSYTTGETLPTSFASTDAEEDWVLANAADNALVTTPEGQWATIRPENAEVIYSVGYVPTRAAPYKVRVIRAAYDFAPFAPGAAILTDGDLHISGEAMIDGAQGNVHANGDVTLEGRPTVSGYASAQGDYEAIGSPTVGQALEGQPEREVPLVDPRENYPMSEYDLCPNGDVRTGPSYSVGDGKFPNTSGVPCGGDWLANASTVEYKAWDMMLGTDPSKGARWRFDGPTGHDGVYYIYRGSAEVSGAPGTPAAPWSVTIFAEATPASGGERDHCPHIGGDIDVGGQPTIRRHDKAQPLQFIAGRDLKVAGNPGTTYEGVLAAHEQFSVSGHPTIRGVVIANDYCDTTGSPVGISLVDITGSAHITYDGGLEVPLGRQIRTTHWNEI
jgi:cytoskeletal protein CcmA (bactofilin family)